MPGDCCAAAKFPAFFTAQNPSGGAGARQDASSPAALPDLEGSHLVRLKSSATTLAEKVALVKEMQYHPISGDVIHADLYEVDLTARIQVNVPLHFIGKAVGVMRGGILQPIVREIEVECLPLDIPQFFDVDVSALDIGDCRACGRTADAEWCNSGFRIGSSIGFRGPADR